MPSRQAGVSSELRWEEVETQLRENTWTSEAQIQALKDNLTLAEQQRDKVELQHLRTD